MYKIIIFTLTLLGANPLFADPRAIEPTPKIKIELPQDNPHKRIDLSGRETSYTPIPFGAPIVDSNSNLFKAVFMNTTPIGSLMSNTASRDIKTKKEMGDFNFIEHLKPDMIPYAAQFALDSSEEEMFETESRVRKELQDKALIAEHPFKSLLISLVLNIPFLALAVIIIMSFSKTSSKQ